MKEKKEGWKREKEMAKNEIKRQREIDKGNERERRKKHRKRK